MSDGPHIRVELISDPKYLCGVRELVSAVADRLGFTEEQCGQIKLAVDEALCNVVRHGYDKKTDRPIWLSLSPIYQGAQVEQLRIVIEDEARQVDPSTIQGRDLNEIRPGGLGMHIINEIMDEVRFERRDPVGMRLTLVKDKVASVAPHS
jgi:serine/threonine-protein kinase RsbW